MSVTVTIAECSFTIAIRKVDELRLHEEVIDEHVDTLIEALRREGTLRDPVIVDAGSDIVLDGMHRVTAADALGLGYIPACEVCYTDPDIKVEGWAKVFDRLSPVAFERAATSVGISLASTSTKAHTSRSIPPPIVVIDGTYCELEFDNTDIAAICAAMRRLFDELEANGFSPRLEPDSYLNGAFDGEEVVVAIPQIPKSTIVEVGSTEFLFPPNTTRHVLPVRPIGLDIPIERLSDDPAVIERWVRHRLDTSAIEFVPPGSHYDGRRYDEALAVIRD